MSLWLKYRRAGAFLIDLALAQMFSQLIINIISGAASFFIKKYDVALSLNSALALPALLSLYIAAMLVVVGVFTGYHWICYRLLGNSLSRYLLGIRVISTSDSVLTNSQYLKRESEKIVFTIATLGLYAFYHAAQFIAFSKQPWHDVRNRTEVVEK